MKKLVFVILSSLLVYTPSFAGISLSNISQQDLENVISDFTSNFTYTTVSGANTLGSVFGFEVGLVGGITNSPELDRLSGSQDVSSMPHAGLIGMVSIPFGFTFEAMLIPSQDLGDGDLSNTGLAVKYTIGGLPFNLAVRGHYTKSEFSYTQDVSGTPTTISFDDTITGANVTASLNLLLAEPYLGLGFVEGDGTLSVAGTNTIYNFTASQSASKKVSGQHIFAGVELKLLMLKFGLEYAKIIDTDRYTGKVSFFF